MKTTFRVLTTAAVLAVCMGALIAQVHVDPKLEQQLATQAGPFEVIITVRSAEDIPSLNTLGVTLSALSQLPMAGATLTKSQVDQLRDWEHVVSLYANEPLEYTNNTSGEITGAHYVQTALGFTGEDVTVLVLDSGIDGFHEDLVFGEKVVQNVKIVSDLGAAGVTATVEGVANTDNTSGHGTHVAGTVAGTGAASADDERDPYYYRGLAPGASLVGVGAGEVLFIFGALQGFDYALANQERYGIDVITNSWGNTSSQFDPLNPISVASYEAYRRGIVVTFAAGNEGPGDNTMSSYAVSPWVVGVAAGDHDRALADFSSRGEESSQFEHPDITAPGVNITSTRAIGTPVGALGPVADLAHPSYTLSYNTLSGTSMATPFVAGTVALMLEANPNLSPDQVESIIMATADPMAGYGFHQTGAGYINVRKAVEVATATEGERQRFLDGDTRWASQGAWMYVEQNDQRLGYLNTWKTEQDDNASGGSYAYGTARKRGSSSDRMPYVRATFYGEGVKLLYPTTKRGGTARLSIDGIARRDVSYFSATEEYGVVTAVTGLPRGPHVLELRGIEGTIYLDALLVDGSIYPSTAQFVDETTTYSGTLGPSVDGVPETQRIPFEVPPNAIQVNADLSWSGGIDVDFYLVDPSGTRVASGATLSNPEVLSYWIAEPGEYAYEVVGYATVTASYDLSSTLVVVQEPVGSGSVAAGGDRAAADEESRTARPAEFSLGNYPNPFNPLTSIRYSIPGGGHVRMEVFNILGGVVARLVDESQKGGSHTIAFDASQLPTGLYFCRLQAGGQVMTRKLLYLK